MDYLAINKKAWDAKTKVHVKSQFYDIPSFVKSKNSLNPIELDALGDVAGKSLLHLQCHFGMDSLSWAHLGATVTAVDLSPVAIEQAMALSKQCKVPADFICDDVIHYMQQGRAFDVVFTSYGAICWLPDISIWAQGVSRQLKAGGTFFMAEFHPIYDLIAGYSYFHKSEPDVEEEGVYTENSENQEKQTIAVWSHPISDVITALIDAGLTIQSFNEYDFSPYDCFENMLERKPGEYIAKHQGKNVPLVYGIKAIKPHA